MQNIIKSVRKKIIRKTLTLIKLKYKKLEVEIDINNLASKLDEIQGTDGFFTTVTGLNTPLEKLLVEANIISKRANGGIFEGKNFEKFYDKIENMRYE